MGTKKLIKKIKEIKRIKKDLQYYLSLPWTFTIEIGKDEDNSKIYILRVNELPGVCTDAPSVDEALELIKDAMLGAFRLYMKLGQEIPEPLSAETDQGNILYRTTSKRYNLLAKEAKKREQSLSQVIDSLVDTAFISTMKKSIK